MKKINWINEEVSSDLIKFFSHSTMLQKIKGKAVKHLCVGFLLLSVEGSRENEGSDSHTDTEMLVGNLE